MAASFDREFEQKWTDWLVERNRLLSMLLDVWYGRGFDLKEGSWSPEKGRPFVETDGRSLYFPAVMPNRDEAVLGLLHAAEALGLLRLLPPRLAQLVAMLPPPTAALPPLLAAACGGAEQLPPVIDAYGLSVERATLGERLNLFTWSDYLDPELVTEFERAYGVQVNID